MHAVPTTSHQFEQIFWIKLCRAHSICKCHVTFKFMMSPPAMSFSRKGRISWHWGGDICPFGINGVRNKQSHLVGPPFSSPFSYLMLAFIKRCSLIGGCGQSQVSAKDGWNYLGAVLSPTTWQNRNWGTFESSREWKWPWEETRTLKS